MAVVNGDRIELREGTLLLIRRGATHEIRNTGPAPLRTLNVYVSFGTVVPANISKMAAGPLIQTKPAAFPTSWK